MSSRVNGCGSSRQLFIFVDKLRLGDVPLAICQTTDGRCAAGLVQILGRTSATAFGQIGTPRQVRRLRAIKVRWLAAKPLKTSYPRHFRRASTDVPAGMVQHFALLYQLFIILLPPRNSPVLAGLFVYMSLVVWQNQSCIVRFVVKAAMR